MLFATRLRWFHAGLPVSLVLGCSLPGCGGSGSLDDVPLPACSAALPSGKTVAPSGDPALGRAGLCLEQGTGALSLGTALQVTGLHPIGPAVLLRLDQAVPPHGVDVVLPVDLTSLPPSVQAGDSPSWQKLVVLAQFGHAPAHVALISNQTVSAHGGGQLRFHLPGHGIAPLSAPGTLGDVATFQVAMPEGLGTKIHRHFSYRAIAGVSMGGIGASMNFFRHPERYDAVGVMGADPGPDLTYTQGFIRDYFFSGFCTAADEKAGRGKIGTACPPTRKPLAGQGEVSGDFEHMPIQQGEGIGLTLKRSLFLRANRDLVRALGNWAYHNPDDPFLPPGVPATTLALSPADACAHPQTLKSFRDGSYNPDGKYDVITFCDGGEPDGMPGVFDGTKDQRDPAQILLAVDVNQNGRRDAGEPVILQSGEPFRDVGADGLPDEMEPGYDPVTNPDPSGDDYHYLKNPGGTEGNWRHDAGEPFDDVGLDGVAGTSDLGEGNGSYDLNPGLRAWLDHDPHTLMEKLPAEQLQQRDIYYDAGIRDFFNANVSTNSLMATLSQQGLGVRVFDGFPALSGPGPQQERQFNVRAVDLGQLGRRAYVRYGNPDLSDAEVMATGDGRHVGTIPQAVSRAVMLFSFLLTRWPGTDTSLQSTDDARLTPQGLVFTQKNGRQSPYGLILPPGYYDPQNAGVTYPLIYFGHGYGMTPEDLGKTTGSIIFSFMSDPDDKRRLPKAILVFMDAKCRPGGDVPGGPVPTDGDLCEEGAFYTDHPAGTYRGESMLEELDAYLAQTYRVRAPADVDVAL